MGMAERRGGDSTDEIEVFAAVDVPHPNARAVVDGERRRAVVRHHGRGPPLLQLLRLRHMGSFVGTTIVPMPSVVKTSSSKACGTRPSSTWARDTPPLTARTHASIFGT